MTSIMGSTSKKSKACMRNDARDRLSELPDEILVNILSFLPILDAVRTVSIRRFGCLWTLIPSLDFNDTEFFKEGNWLDKPCSDEQIPCLISFMNNVLMLHKGIPVNKFLLRFYNTDVRVEDHESLITDINSWIRFAIGRQVKELHVRFEFEVYFDPILPSCVFTSRFLVVLELVNCEIEELNQVQMGSLRKLSLTFVQVRDKIEKIMSGCPSLQELVLRHVEYLDELRFTAPNIEKLDLDSYEICVLDCPSLKILNICLGCYFGSQKPYLKEFNIPSVHEVHIQSIRPLDGIVNKICHVEVVKFSEEAFQQSNLKELDIPQTRWRCLHIESQLTEDQLIGICRVLRSSPHLEELVVFSESLSKTCDQNILSEELSFPCEVPQLKSVTIRGHKVHSQGLLQLAEFLLKSCIKLEKIVILPSTYKLVPVKELKFVKQICSFPRASANARVICGSEIY